MDIKFTGKYKSITAFEWSDIPKFAVITGPNGTGKSQLLKLIYNTVIKNPQEKERVTIENETIQRHEISFIQSEWELKNTTGTSIVNIIKQQNKYYDLFKQHRTYSNRLLYQQEFDLEKIKLYAIFSDIYRKIGKAISNISQEEFNEILPDFFIENELLLTQKIEETFSNYRLSETV